jgi:excisionase family DNA binding protein
MDKEQERMGPAGARGLWTVKDVAAFLRVSKTWVYERAEQGLLPVVRFPGSTLVRFDPAMIEKVARGEWKPPRDVVLPLKRAG